MVAVPTSNKNVLFGVRVGDLSKITSCMSLNHGSWAHFLKDAYVFYLFSMLAGKSYHF
jgi:hypothetical protein